jgi:hypothetical protein
MILKKLGIAIIALCIISISCNRGNSDKVTYNKTYHQNGKLFEVIPLVKGVVHGNKIEYYDTGVIRKESPYTNGTVNGTVKFYYPDGKLYSETPRVNGLIEGLVVKYHNNGLVLSETPYLNDEVQPGLKEYDNKGRLREPYRLVFVEHKTKRNNDLKVDLEVRVEPSVNLVKFLQNVSDKPDKYLFIPIFTKDKLGQLNLILPQGSSIELDITIKAEFYTNYNNNGVLIETYKLRAHN